ncbi:hypothetical protein LEMLEM_LOCUS21961 [Lemmus lemmus]
MSCASLLSACLAAHLVWTPWSPSLWPSAAAVGPVLSVALTVGVPGLNRWPVTSPASLASSSSEAHPLTCLSQGAGNYPS